MAAKGWLIINFALTLQLIQAQSYYPAIQSQRAIPAARGQIPPCAKNTGLVYCETIPNYPRDLVRKAISNNPFDISKFFVDETTDDPPDFLALTNPNRADEDTEIINSSEPSKEPKREAVPQQRPPRRAWFFVERL